MKGKKNWLNTYMNVPTIPIIAMQIKCFYFLFSFIDQFNCRCFTMGLAKVIGKCLEEKFRMPVLEVIGG